jgi:predicted nucleotidyltransferase
MMNKPQKHTIAKRDKEKITKTISSYLQRHEEIFAAYIFGSYVSDELFGDIDLGILVQVEPENLLDYEFELEINLEKLVKIPVDVRVLNKAPASFAQNVIRHKMLIIDKDPNRRADFESYVLRTYFDFAPFRRQYLAEVINARI